MLSVRDFSLSIGGALLFKDLSFEVLPREVLIIQGSSGCGKSSLFHFLAGINTACEGSVIYGNRLLSKGGKHLVLPEHGRGFGMVFQERTLFQQMSVAKNIAFGAKEGFEAALELVELGKGVAERYPHELSVGEQQRVELARTLVSKPRVLLLDEPFSGLDKARRQSILPRLKKYWVRHNMVVLLITHSDEEADLCGDRFARVKENCLSVH